MLTPDGRHCSYYYIDAHRRLEAREVCHLLAGNPDADQWTSDLCASCPVPEIKRANQCEHMVLNAQIKRYRLQFWRAPEMQIVANCLRSGGRVSDPMVGCGLCHTPIQFVVYDGADKEPKTGE